MASQSSQQPTNERIVQLLEELKAQQQQIARDLSRLLERR
jgi:hypothetical protein